jgi:D-alanyl-D-alanine carboxypeptidase/D-alanyl-D-alanine-endopeptidase (penicillin-binding protein 4)
LVAVAAGVALTLIGIDSPQVAHADRTGKRVKRHAGKMVRKARRRYRRPRVGPSPFRLHFNPSVSQKDRLERRIDLIWKSSTLRPGRTAVMVKDAQSGEVLYSRNADAKVNPASNVKLIATATVLDTLGANWRYVTRIFGPTPNADGIAKGDIYLRGNYDPTFTTSSMRNLAVTLAARGITRIEGDLVLGTDSQRDGYGRPWVWVKVRGGKKKGDPPTVKIYPESNFIKLDVTATTSYKRWPRTRVRGAVTKTEADGEHYRLSISGEIRRNTTRRFRRWIPARVPFAAGTLSLELEKAGIELAGNIRRQTFADYVSTAGKDGFIPIELAVHRSKPISRLVTRVNKRSLNWLADGLIESAGAYAYGGKPDMAKGVRLMERWLAQRAGIRPADVVLDTGSGLSYATELTAEQIVRVLRVAGGFDANPTKAPKQTSLSKIYRHSLSVAGVDGTLRHRYRGTRVRGKMIGKTGTLRNVIATSGVVKLKSGRALAFSIVTNGTPRNWRWHVRRQHDWMVRSMYDYLQKTALAEKKRKASHSPPHQLATR